MQIIGYVRHVFLCVAFNENWANARPAPEVGGRTSISRLSSPADPQLNIGAPNFDYTCFIKEDGTLQCWGENGSGQLGLFVPFQQPVQPSPITVEVNNAPLSNVISVATGTSHACALRADGTVFCWGEDLHGQLGIGTILNFLSPPVQVRGVNNVGFLTNVVSLAAGRFHTCALIVDGTVRCWGSNTEGQLGTGDSTGADQTLPVTVRGINNNGILNNVISLAAGEQHTCALSANGTVQCWGRNVEGQLGSGEDVIKTFPVTVGGLSNVTALTAGNHTSCAVLSDGTVQCWGNNREGQLGIGTTDFLRHLLPVPIPSSTLNNVLSISAGGHHICVLIANGTVRCWGRNTEGQLGTGGTTDLLSPPSASISGLTNVVAIAAGTLHTCALRSDETIQCWGDDSAGQLGNGLPLTNSPNPVAVSGLSGSISGRGIVAGNQHTCARRASSTAGCWGDNTNGQLGNTTINDSPLRLR